MKSAKLRIGIKVAHIQNLICSRDACGNGPISFCFVCPVVAGVLSQLNALSSASWTDCNLPLDFVNVDCVVHGRLLSAFIDS